MRRRQTNVSHVRLRRWHPPQFHLRLPAEACLAMAQVGLPRLTLECNARCCCSRSFASLCSIDLGGTRRHADVAVSSN
jgi:hypothetical protein